MAVRIRVGIVTQAFAYVRYWAGVEKGIYAAAGQEVEISVLGGIDTVTDALKRGEIQIGIGSPEHVIQDVENGGSLRIVGGNINRLPHSLIVQPEIKKLEDLRGKIIGVSSFSGGTSSLFMDLLERVGLRYQQDYKVVEAGAVPPRHEKLLRREIDAAMQTDPHNYIAEDAGLTNLGLLLNWVPYFQFSSVNVEMNWANENTSQLVQFLASSILAARWMFDDKEIATDIAMRHMQIKENYAQRAWEDYVTTDAVPRDLHLQRQSIEVTLDMMRRDRASSFQIPKDARSEDYVALGFLSEAQKLSGVPQNLLI